MIGRVNFPEFSEGMSRRDFLKLLTIATATMGLPVSFVKKLEAALKAPDRPPVIWLHFQECTGCTESLLRATNPDLAKLIFDLISLDYHETLMAAAGNQAESVLTHMINKNVGKFICVVEGSIPLKDDGIYCQIGGKKAVDILKEVSEKAAAIVAIGNCASFGGVQSVDPNPTGASGVLDVIKDKPVINVPGCPPNPYNILATLLYYLTFKKIPELDKYNRPKFAYGRRIHDHCPRRAHFDAGRFAREYGDEGHRQGWCLYQLGCKGPVTYANCPTTQFNDIGVWPIGIGHPCVGCTEPKVGFHLPVKFRVKPQEVVPPEEYPPIKVRQGKATVAGVAAASAAVGAALGAAGVIASRLPDKKEGKEDAGGETKKS